VLLDERETQLSALQWLTLVDATASWLSEPNGGDQLAHALLTAACMAEVTAEHAYLALITSSKNPEDHSEGSLVVAKLQASIRQLWMGTPAGCDLRYTEPWATSISEQG
jgi:hypothetical protein